MTKNTLTTVEQEILKSFKEKINNGEISHQASNGFIFIKSEEFQSFLLESLQRVRDEERRRITGKIAYCVQTNFNKFMKSKVKNEPLIELNKLYDLLTDLEKGTNE